MEHALPFLIMSVFAVISAIGTAIALKRARDIGAVARRAGLQYSLADPFASDRIAFSLFRKGDGKEVENVLWPEGHERKLRAFDFAWYDLYRDDKGNETRRYRRFSCALALVGGSWPAITVTREGVADRLIAAVAPATDIDFESEEFNRTFVVRCDDRRFAHALIDAAMIDFLVSTAGLLSFELRGRWLLVWSDRVKPRLVPGLLRVAERFCEQIPDVVWELYPSEFVDDDRKPLSIEDEGLLSLERQVLEDRAGSTSGRLDRSPYDAVDEPEGPEYDLDGNPIVPRPENPWGDLPA